ncbi:MAG: DUF4389 domain-containing protein [Pseudomonadota bacterium]
MTSPDSDNIDGRLHGEQPDPGPADPLGRRVLHMVLVAILLYFAQTILSVITIVQLVILLVDNRKPNARLADFGTDLGIWIAKAARFQTAASDVKPWPWTELD